MAQLAAIELHPSLSLGRAPKRPTVLAFDLDPGPPADIVDCCRVALRLRELFDHFGVECFPKTSGSKGMQVYVPLNTQRVTTSETKPFAKAIAQLLEKQTPDQVVSKMKKVDRRARSSSTGPRTTAARRRSPSTPCAPANGRRPRPRSPGRRSKRAAEQRRRRARWSSRPDDVLERVEEHGDLFAPVLELEQDLPGALAPGRAAAASGSRAGGPAGRSRDVARSRSAERSWASKSAVVGRDARIVETLGERRRRRRSPRRCARGGRPAAPCPGLAAQRRPDRSPSRLEVTVDAGPRSCPGRRVDALEGVAASPASPCSGLPFGPLDTIGTPRARARRRRRGRNADGSAPAASAAEVDLVGDRALLLDRRPPASRRRSGRRCRSAAAGCRPESTRPRSEPVSLR